MRNKIKILLIAPICFCLWSSSKRYDFHFFLKRGNRGIENDEENDVGNEKTDSKGPERSSGTDDEDLLNIGESLPFPVDYSSSDLLTWLKRGDILYDFVGADLGLMMTGHIAIIEGIFWDTTYNQYYVRTIEANPTIGVARGLLTPERFNDNKCILRVETATEAIKYNAVQFCIDELGQGYSGLFSQQNEEHSPIGWYCSELVWAAYYSEGIDIDGGNRSGVWPGDIAASGYTKTIMHYSQTTTFTTTGNYHVYHCNNDVFEETHNHLGEYQGHDRCTICGYIFWPSC